MDNGGNSYCGPPEAVDYSIVADYEFAYALVTVLWDHAPQLGVSSQQADTRRDAVCGDGGVAGRIASDVANHLPKIVLCPY